MMLETISAIVAGISALIAVISAIMVFYQTKKGWYINVIPPQRLEWAENLRVAVADFAAAFYKGEDLRGFRDRIVLYLNPNNGKHTLLIAAINDVCSGKQNDVGEVIAATQGLLRWNWWIVKSESTISHRAEVRRDKTVQERAKWHEANQNAGK